MAQLPVWFEARQDDPNRFDETLLEKLDDGERAVIGLAASLKADLLLMDDRKGVKHARDKGFGVTGTLEILEPAAEHGFSILAMRFHYRGRQLSAVRGKSWMHCLPGSRIMRKSSHNFTDGIVIGQLHARPEPGTPAEGATHTHHR